MGFCFSGIAQRSTAWFLHVLQKEFYVLGHNRILLQVSHLSTDLTSGQPAPRSEKIEPV
uniref:Uncharacterized protein n=1 Tax=Myoviridae sp. ct5ra14 TaxID=2827659 RepID=A0A8S5T1G7_9CAUD|nr:MAG TPA: hypothetical protein [Myoviridae sp. ct5ra14]